MSTQDVAIIGAGPVGGILAANLVRAGFEVTVIDVFREHLDAIREKGLTIEGKESFTVPLTSLFVTIEEAAKAGKRFDVVFICVKATVNDCLTPTLPLIVKRDGVAVSLQNGLDTEKSLASQLGADRTLRAVCNYAGNMVAPSVIKLTFFNPPNYIGRVDSNDEKMVGVARKVAALMTASGLDCQYTEELQRHVWEKVIRNAALMPISALTGMDILQVVESKWGLRLVEELLREAIAVANKIGIEFNSSYFEDSINYYMRAGHHMPSMWGDVQDKRITEIEYLNHKIAEYGEKHGVDVQYNRSLANLVLCIDELALASIRERMER